MNAKGHVGMNANRSHQCGYGWLGVLAAFPLLVRCGSDTGTTQDASAGPDASVDVSVPAPGSGGASAAGGAAGVDGSLGRGGAQEAGLGGAQGSDASTGGTDASAGGALASSGGAGGTTPLGAGGDYTDASFERDVGETADADGSMSDAVAEQPDGERDAPLSRAIVWRAYWSFDEIANDKFIDQTGHGFDATTLNTSVTTGPGVSNSAMALNGLGESQGDTACAAQAPASTIDTYQDFSVSAWVYFNIVKQGKFETIVSKDGAQNSAFFLQKRPALTSGADDSLAFVVYKADKVDSNDRCPVMANINPKPGRWYHVAGTYSASTGRTRVYVDGVMAGERACSCFTSNGPLQLGRGKWLNTDMPWTTYRDYFSGSIDEVGVTDMELTSAEIAQVYATHVPASGSTYLFEYSTSESDGMRLAASHDGALWTPIRSGTPILTPLSVAGQTLLKSPDAKRGPDGIFHALWTSSSGGAGSPSGSFGYAESADLVNWSNKKAIGIVDTDAGMVNVLAPESIYDEASGRYMVYWSSTDQASSASSIYYSMTSDFVTFDAAKVLLAPGYSVTDPTIVKTGTDAYAIFVRDDSTAPNTIRISTAPSLPGNGSWTTPTAALSLASGATFQSPSLAFIGGAWVLYVEQTGICTAFSSTDLATWTPFPVSMPSGARHGTIVELPNSTYSQLLKNLSAGL